MLQESLIYFSNSFRSPRHVKKFGLLEELIAIDARYKRNKSAWQEHLVKTKFSILSEAAKLNQREKILILGAGSLNDLPLAELSAMFQEVHLVDIFFLNSTLKKIKAYSNVKIHEVDITNTLKGLYSSYDECLRAANHKLLIACLTENTVPDFLQNEKVDMVVSLNLLSQLPLAVKSFFEKRKLTFPELYIFYKSLITDHLSYLQKFSEHDAKVLLITDVEKQISHSDGEMHVENSLQGINLSKVLGKPLDTWIWHLAPHGELEHGFEMSLQVALWTLN